MNYACSLTEPEQPSEMLDLLSRYLQLAPAMIPPSTSDDLNAFTLWHPDLHLDNLFVNYNTMQVTSVVDWQSAAAVPYFIQCRVPKIQYQKPVSSDL